MTEEDYAKLLALSAKRTNIAIEYNKRAIEEKPLLRQLVKPFCEVRKENNHDIKVFLKEFANLSEVSIDVLLGRNRNAIVSDARNVMFYVMHKHMGFSTPQIARIFQRDVSTIQTGKARGKEIIDYNKFLVQLIDEVLNKSKIENRP